MLTYFSNVWVVKVIIFFITFYFKFLFYLYLQKYELCNNWWNVKTTRSSWVGPISLLCSIFEKKKNEDILFCSWGFLHRWQKQLWEDGENTYLQSDFCYLFYCGCSAFLALLAFLMILWLFEDHVHLHRNYYMVTFFR